LSEAFIADVYEVWERGRALFGSHGLAVAALRHLPVEIVGAARQHCGGRDRSPDWIKVGLAIEDARQASASRNGSGSRRGPVRSKID
jgi:hypothetical protein